MGTCPICGSSIPENLVKAIQDPSQPEKCPKRGRGEPKPKNISPEIDYDPDDYDPMSDEETSAMFAFLARQLELTYGVITQKDFVLAHG